MSRTLSFGRLTLLVAIAAMVGASAADARIHSLTGDARLQIGNGLPIPIGLTSAPNGRIAATASATARQHGVHAATATAGGARPARLIVDPTQLTAPGNAINLPVFLSNPNVFQVQTAVPIQWPNRKIQFEAGRIQTGTPLVTQLGASGRTGARTVTFCPGETVTADGNPGCAIGAGAAIKGSLRYVGTLNQFGGPAQATTGGAANVALKGGPAGAPCAGPPACIVAMALATPANEAAPGQPFGFFNQTAGAAPPSGVFFATITGSGSITGVGALLTTGGTPMNPLPGVANPATSYGGPWTTGRVTITQSAAVPSETFIISGGDARAAGLGTGSISLVAGAVSARTLSGPNANRGWLNLTIGALAQNVPVLPAYGVAALVGLTALSGAYALRRRASK